MMPPTVVLATVDCLRADHVGWMGAKDPTSPFLDSLSRSGQIFRHAYASGSPTFFSFPGIMAARSPLALGRDVVGIAPGELTLAEQFRRCGYATAAFVAANPYLSARFGYDQGFDVFEDHLASPDAAAPVKTGPLPFRSRFNQKLRRWTGDGAAGFVYDELYFQYCQKLSARRRPTFDSLRRFPSADVIVEKAVDWLRNRADVPVFLWLHFMDPHAPYYPQESALRSLPGPPIDAAEAQFLNSLWNRSGLSHKRLSSVREKIMRLYSAGVRWVDSQLQRFANSLRTLDRWEGCTFALTADHGEEFLEHGGKFHSPEQLSEQTINVPLLLRAPAIPCESVTSAFSLSELPATLLRTQNLAPPREFTEATLADSSFHDKGDDRLVAVETASQLPDLLFPPSKYGSRRMVITNGRLKLVIDFATATQHLFDLAADPSESQPLPQGTEQRSRKRMLEFAHERLERSLEQRNWELALAANLRQFAAAREPQREILYA